MARTTYLFTIALMTLLAITVAVTEEGREDCPDSFERIGSKCYHFSFIGRTFEDSRSYCQGLIHSGNGSADLAVFGYDFVDFDIISDYLNVEDISFAIWVGLDDFFSEGDWFWLDGTPQTKSSAMWACDEPSTSSSYNCGTIFKNSETRADRYRLMDNNCDSNSLYSLCQYGAISKKSPK